MKSIFLRAGIPLCLEFVLWRRESQTSSSCTLRSEKLFLGSLINLYNPNKFFSGVVVLVVLFGNIESVFSVGVCLISVPLEDF